MPTSSSWYLLKAEDGSIFGPMPFEQLGSWANTAQVSPLDKISTDQTTWIKAPMLPELGMDWLVELSSEQLYGPTTLGSIQEFLNTGEINGETILINARDGSNTAVAEIAGLIVPPEQTEAPEPLAEPFRTGIRSSLQQRIRQLETTLLEERRALESLEERYLKLEARYEQIIKRTP